MADKDIIIGVKTTGTQESAKAIHQVDAAMSDLAATSQRETVRAFENVQDKAKVSEFAFYDLNNEIAKTKGTSETYTAGATKMAKSSRDNSTALLLFSQGLEDAQYGIRGVLNNIPGLVLSLGGTAGLAGAISIAAVGLAQLEGLFTSTATKAKEMTEKIGEIATNAGTLETERFDTLKTKIDDAADAVDVMRGDFVNAKEASANFATASLADADKVATAQRNIAILLGQQVDAYAELEAAQKRAEEKRKLTADQQIQTETQRAEDAKRAVGDAADRLGQLKALADTEQANLVAIRGELAAARTERDALTKQARGANAFGGPNLFAPGGGIGFAPAQVGDVRQANEAARQVADPALKANIAALEARADALDAAILTLTKDGGIVQKAENAFVAAQTKLTDITSAVGINIGRIEQTLAKDNLVARSEGLITSQEQQATTLSEALSKIETTNATAVQAKAAIEAIVADGQITAAESDQLARASVQLIGQIQAGLATAGTNTQEILQIITQVASQNQSNKQQIEQLRKQVENLQR
jgi:polyhydroxyalkanoate synthesis regulator phasin